MRNFLNAVESMALRDSRFTDVYRPYLVNPFINGVEVTQGIQYYGADQHLTNADDQGPDNSVTLVAFKPAWVRVYVRTGFFGSDQTLTGDLGIDRMGPLPGLFQPITTLTPRAPGTVATQRNPDYATERSTIGATLVFIIPADEMLGILRLTARIWIQGGNASSPVDTFETTIDVTLAQTLRLRGILINYNGPDPTVNPTNPPNINLPAPTLADLQTTAAWTLTTNPVESQGIFSSAGTLQWGTPLTGMATNPGGCSTQWLNLNAAVAQVKANDGNRSDVIYYGLLPAGTPIANVGGCESSGVSTGPNGRQVTMAHEIGHGAGLAHGPCGTPGDANYPAYEPYDPANSPTASLGEYGLDINNGAIHPPSEKDYMSYCSPRWISLYHHKRLLNNAKFNPRTVGRARLRIPDLVDPYLWPWEYIPDPPPWEIGPGDFRMKATKVISIIGVVDEQRQVEVRSVMRVTALAGVQDARASSLVAQLVGRDGKIAASAPAMRLEGQGCGCCGEKEPKDPSRGPFLFQAMVPDVDPGAELRIVRVGKDEREEDKTVWIRRAPDSEPKVSSFDVRVGGRVGTARWDARAADGTQLEFTLQFSKDDGRSWNGLATGLREQGHQFDISTLPEGKLVFRLLAHDGFFTATAESKTVKVPGRPPVVSILHPQEGPVLIAGQPMRLWGTASTSTGERVKSDQCSWRIDGKDVARGIDTVVDAPSKGEHRCTLTVESPQGKAEAEVRFQTVDAADPEPPSGKKKQKPR